MLVPVVAEALQRAGVDRREVGFTCAGSCDYLTGGPFVFVSNLEAAGAWPPISESHVEMDGAWALYEAWVRLQHGDIDTALVFGSGKSSPSKPAEVWAQQLDPYYLAPAGRGSRLARGARKRGCCSIGARPPNATSPKWSSRSRRQALDNPNAEVRGEHRTSTTCSRRRTCARRCAGTTSRRSPTARSRSCSPAVTARGACAHARRGYVASTIASRCTNPGCATSATSSSTTLAARKAGYDGGPLDVAELSATFSPQELILREALGLPADTM